MIHTDPRTAPPRPDLTFLRHRARVQRPAPPPVEPTAPAAVASSSLDLDAPAPAAATPAAAAAPTIPASVQPVVPAHVVEAGQRTVLSLQDPAVTLNRLQSAIGTLTIEAAVSDTVGDVRLGCAYELASGVESTVQVGSGHRVGPPDGRRPLLVASRDRYDRVGIDLRQCTQLRRFAVYVFSDSRQQVTWGGTLVATTFSGARVEIPLESMSASTVGVVLTGYNVQGRLVLRAELDASAGSIRDAARAYGFDRITWLDDRTPVE